MKEGLENDQEEQYRILSEKTGKTVDEIRNACEKDVAMSAKEAKEFGLSLAEFFAQRVPPESIPATEKKPLRKVGEVVSKLHAQVERFRADHKLNMYKKAKLANAFQWKLFDLGYDKLIVQELTKELLRHL